MAKICKMLNISVKNEPGRLAKVSGSLKDAGIDICAVAGWVEGDTGKMMLCTDDPEKACGVLSDVVDNCGFVDGVCVEVDNQVGALAGIAEKIAEAGINITSIHASPGDAEKATIVLRSENNEKLAEILD